MSREVTEATLKADLCAYLKGALPGCVPIRHEDLVKTRAGVPDISLTWHWSTSWIEGKLANPKIRTKHKVQTLTMLQLAATSHAFYVIWHLTKEGEARTYVVAPIVIHENRWHPEIEHVKGFRHDYVEKIIRGLHRP